jgi:hypothetical protein
VMSNSTNEERLLNLRNECKISQQEYEALLAAMYKKHSFAYKFFTYIFNPFRSMHPLVGIIVGLIVICVFAFIGVMLPAKFPGMMTTSLYYKGSLQFLPLLKQQAIIWLTTSVIFWLIAVILGSSWRRFFDFLAFTGVARVPYMLALLLDCALYRIDHKLVDTEKVSLKGMIGLYYGSLDIIVVSLIAWTLLLYFTAFSEATELNNSRRWFGYICGMILSMVILAVWLNPPVAG